MNGKLWTGNHEELWLNRMCYPQSDIDRLCIPKMEGERGLLTIADCVKTEKQNLPLYRGHPEAF